MLGQPEDGTAFRRLVRADSLEHAGAVVEAVRPDVDLRVGPVHELAVHPNLFEFLHEEFLLLRAGWAGVEFYPGRTSSTFPF